MFPLLQLPLLCIQEITNQWDVIDLYNFSLLSKTAKIISRRKKRNNLEVGLNFALRSISLNTDYHVYGLILDQNRFIAGQRENLLNIPDISSFLQATQHFIDVFNCPFGIIDLHLQPPLIIEYQLILIINWLNEIKNEIRTIKIVSATGSMFELFMNGLQRSVGELITHQKDGKGYKNLNFQVNTYFFADPCLWFNLEFLLSMDSKGISIHTTNFSAEDLNVFLRSWQEGKTNWNLEQVKLRTYYARDMKEVLKGCKGEYMDPRTTKLRFCEPRSQGYQWIYGGIHIRRNDGRLAVIQTGFDDYYVEDNGASEREIRTYLATRQVWESENSRYAWCEHWFRIYVF